MPPVKNTQRKIQKNLKNLLTFLEVCSIIVKLTAESGRICSLKIEQQKKSRALKSADLVNNTLKKETQKSKKKLEKALKKMLGSESCLI